MLRIRLRRQGGRHDPHYRVVVSDRRASRDGPFLEVLGHYHPDQKTNRLRLDVDRAEEWIGKGARPSSTVRRLLKVARAQPPAEVAVEATQEPAAKAAKAAKAEVVEEPAAEADLKAETPVAAEPAPAAEEQAADVEAPAEAEPTAGDDAEKPPEETAEEEPDKGDQDG